MKVWIMAILVLGMPALAFAQDVAPVIPEGWYEGHRNDKDYTIFTYNTDQSKTMSLDLPLGAEVVVIRPYGAHDAYTDYEAVWLAPSSIRLPGNKSIVIAPRYAPSYNCTSEYWANRENGASVKIDWRVSDKTKGPKLVFFVPEDLKLTVQILLKDRSLIPLAKKPGYF